MNAILSGRKPLVYAALVLAGAALFFAVYEYNRPASDRTMESSAVTLSARELHSGFLGGDSLQSAEWLNQIVEVTGEVQSAKGATVMLVPGVVCTFEESPDRSHCLEGSEVTLKGRVLGFDDLFNEVRMDFCLVVLNP
jgi:hypothetical protein